MQMTYAERDSLTARHLELLSPAWIENIAYSPDDFWILFESLEENNNRDIYLMSAQGENVTRLTEDTGADFDPAWRLLR
ncbi:MAG: hypothetical protein AUJ21_05885 [Anaerolineae bacterium CG1_02_58_13]|nr:MAG: hypothetical protein AUJ21_05885 [Anaerolineae bacterium CG1_02_58_13]